jgi:tripeptide aminopeptidase
LPKNTLSPESTEGMEGFIHPTNITGMVEMATVEFIIRDFTVEKLHAHELVLTEIMNNVLRNYPNSKATFEVHEQYRNMKEVLDKVPHVSEYAMEAIRRSGIEANRRSIRGGTDGSRLSFMGLPCPNIFAGEHAFHGKHEWVSVQDMEKAVEVIVNLCMVWEERSV